MMTAPATCNRRRHAAEHAPCYADAANDASRTHGISGVLVLVHVTHTARCPARRTGNPWSCHCAPDIAALVQLDVGG
jgi:hypothetical protein